MSPRAASGALAIAALSACSAPFHGVPLHDLPAIPAEVKQWQQRHRQKPLRIQLVEFLVGYRKSFYRSNYATITATGLFDASWRMARSLEAVGFAVESERLSQPTDLRLSVVFTRPEPAKGHPDYLSKLSISVFDGRDGRLLVRRQLDKSVAAVSMWSSRRQSLGDGRPNWKNFSAMALGDVVSAIGEATARLDRR